ncbi:MULTISPECIES: hypothetical protein [Streptomyces]|nr:MULTISPECIES: hypothetical protein [Streptomyces]MDI5910423.1 hypothetical protein [Streptomyces sp. 12257]
MELRDTASPMRWADPAEPPTPTEAAVEAGAPTTAAALLVGPQWGHKTG